MFRIVRRKEDNKRYSRPVTRVYHVDEEGNEIEVKSVLDASIHVDATGATLKLTILEDFHMDMEDLEVTE